jgi:trimethylamine:corrinoid methyltransferase-like protein
MATALRLNPLTAEEVSTIYEKCLDYLSKTGVKVSHSHALKILDNAGAGVDFSNQQARFSRDLIEKALGAAPRHFTLAGGNETNDLILPHPDGAFYTASNTGATSYLDPDSNTYRDITVANLTEWVQLLGCLDGIDVCAFPVLSDVPGEIADIYALKTYFENTPKHIWVQPHRTESLEYLFHLALIAAGSEKALRTRPLISIISNSLTPLEFPAMDVEVIIQASRYGVPVTLCALPIAGATSPITPAGSVLLCAIENLAAVVMSQLIEPGTPVLSGHHRLTLDMLTGKSLMTSLEAILGEAASAQFIRETYGIPTIAFGYGTGSSIPDGQSMIDGTLLGLLVSLGGTDILEGAGGLDDILVISPIQLILDSTLAHNLKRVGSGVKIEDGTLAWKELLETVPGGHFLERDHTMRHCREGVRSDLFNYQPRDIWRSEGGKCLYTRALEKYGELRRGLKPLDLAEDLRRDLNGTVENARKKLVR